MAIHDLRASLTQALSIGTVGQRVDAIKEAVSKEVSDVDPTATIKHTEYFNHSRIPDLVIKWPGENRERFLFLRDVQSSEWLRQDVREVAANKPIVLSLESLSMQELADGDRGNVADSAQTAGVWLTDPGGMDAVSRSQGTGAVTTLLGQALIRGGRGLVAEPEAQLLRSSAESGFEAAAALEPDGTGAAVNALEHAMESDQSARFTRVLRAVWEGNGGSSASFPRADTIGRLSIDDLAYLLTNVEDASSDFWRRLGGGFTLENIASLGVPETLKSFQLFISANVDRLTAKAVRLRNRPASLFAQEDDFSWTRERDAVGLSGPGFLVVLAPRLLEQLPSAENVDGIGFDELLRRKVAASVDIPCIEALLGDGAKISYDANESGKTASLEKLRESLATWNNYQIVRGACVSRHGRVLQFDLTTRTSWAPTSGQVAVDDLILSTLPLLQRVPEDLVRSLANFLTVVDTKVEGVFSMFTDEADPE